MSLRALGSVSGAIYNLSRVGVWAVIQAGVTAKLHSSYNVATFTDNGAGDFTLTFTVPFADASSYAIICSANSGNFTAGHTADGVPPLAGSARVVTIADALNAQADRDPTTVIGVGRR